MNCLKCFRVFSVNRHTDKVDTKNICFPNNNNKKKIKPKIKA